jgi:L-asparaginase
MASLSPAAGSVTLVIATGGTIAGRADDAGDNVGYRAGAVSAEALLAAVPALAHRPLEAVQLAQLDSKDMTHALWRRLSATVQAAVRRTDVGGVVITHGTDTLEETAYWLHRTVDAVKPVVLTAAMRPASSLQADGPQNLLDAVTVASQPGACGVVAVLAGRVWAGHELRKVHNYRLEAFSAGDAGPVALMEEGRLRPLRGWPRADAVAQPPDGPPPPWIEIVHSHAGAGARAVEALVQAGVEGLVVAATGNGTVHADLLVALQAAAARGLPVVRATRCALGHLVDDGQWPPGLGGLTPAQARVELLWRRWCAAPGEA